jgi:FixJ family two-component response regulator
VLGDRVLLQQALINLVMNSIDAMRSTTRTPRELLIKSAKNRNELSIQVQDSETWPDPQLAEHIFEPEGIGMMTEVASVVFVVDDDPSIRRAIKRLVESVGLRVEGFGSAQEFLRSQRPDAPSCLVLDIRLPGISGLDFQRELREANIHSPIIFISAHGDIPMTVRAMKAGAVEFLTKPFRDQELLDAIQQGLERDHSRRAQEREVAKLRERFESLTPRERELLPWVVSGLLNKQIAYAIDVSEATVKVHRSQLMRKMGASSMADLVRMTEKMGIAAQRTS